MSDLTVTHKGLPVLAYRHDADWYCTRCGVPESILQRSAIKARSTPCGLSVQVAPVIVYTITDETELYDGGLGGEHSELAVRYRHCATCGESLDPDRAKDEAMVDEWYQSHKGAR